MPAPSSIEVAAAGQEPNLEGNAAYSRRETDRGVHRAKIREPRQEGENVQRDIKTELE